MKSIKAYNVFVLVEQKELYFYMDEGLFYLYCASTLSDKYFIG